MKDALPMLLATALVALASTALAQQLWRERDGNTLRLYPGEPVEGLRERGGAVLDRITGPRLLPAGRPATLSPARRAPR